MNSSLECGKKERQDEKGAPQQPTANDRPHPGYVPHLKSHISAPFSLVLFVWTAEII
jgi:hypothetical protein